MVLRKKGGIGATGSPFAKFLHPSDLIRARWPNDWKSRQCAGARITGKGMHNVSRKSQLCYECILPEYDDTTTFHIVCCNFKVLVVGPSPFDDEVDATPRPAAPANVPPVQEDANITPEQQATVGWAADIADLRADGVEVDDEGPAPENAVDQPTPTEQVGVWEKQVICPRRSSGIIGGNTAGRWKEKSWCQIVTMSEFAIFRLTFPEEYIRSVIIPATNIVLEGEQLTLREFYVWLGCRFFIACHVGEYDTRAWWSKKPPSRWEGAPHRLNDIIERNRFEDITRSLRLTNIPPPTFLDGFYEIRQLHDAFNDYYEENYFPSWLSCLDESMSPWTNKYCPGYMFVPRKPHPFGNEYHSIADGDQGKPIMWRVKIQEGKDRPMNGNTPRYPSQFECYSTTAKLMLEMSKPLFNTGKIVTMDSGFCVTAGILAMHDHGMFGQALIKKRGRYWPVHVPGDQIDEHFANLSIGDVDTLKQSIDNKNFLVHCTKDDGYVTKIMSTHGTLREITTHGTRRVVNGTVHNFKYVEPLSRHNIAKHFVDDVNNRRHDPIGLDSGWPTKNWAHRQLAFFLSVSEVNALNSQARGRKMAAVPTLVFRKKLAKQMIFNKLSSDGIAIPSPTRPKKRRSEVDNSEHQHLRRPNYSGAWDERIKDFSQVGTEYLKTKCATCKNETRMYCSCNKKVSMCTTCWGTHRGLTSKGDSVPAN